MLTEPRIDLAELSQQQHEANPVCEEWEMKLRALRGLTIGLSLSALNMLGLFLTLLLFGGLGDYSGAQFVGVFGIFEIATALAFVFCPNIWRLPVMEAETSDRTAVHLALSAIRIPHWAGGAKAIAGAAMVAWSGWKEGYAPEAVLILPFSIAVGVFVMTASAIAARLGVLRPDLDVVQFVIRRPGKKEMALPGTSITASFLQIMLGTFTLPALKLLPPSAFFSPGIGPSFELTLWSIGVAALTTAGMFWTWRGRLAWQAPREQQRKAEEPA